MLQVVAYNVAANYICANNIYMANVLTGSIDVDAFAAAIKEGKGSQWTTASGKRMINIVVFLADSPDQYGNTATIKLAKPKDGDDPKVYLANLKPSGQAPTDNQQTDLPF